MAGMRRATPSPCWIAAGAHLGFSGMGESECDGAKLCHNHDIGQWSVPVGVSHRCEMSINYPLFLRMQIVVSC